MSQLKILCGYPYFPSKAYRDLDQWEKETYDYLRKAGFDVEGFCLTLSPPAHCLPFYELDLRWRRRDKELLEMYDRLEKALRGKDVFINNAGINLHPEFVKQLSVFTVFQCFDDPENFDWFSKPVAHAYDLCLVGNIAEVESYHKWGIKNAEWMPMGLALGIYNTELTYEKILEGQRDIDLFMLSDRQSFYRRRRLDKMAQAFPDAHFYGRGWPKGYLPYEQELSFLSRAKIGPNISNSTGPVNFRTFYLPANGVLLIGDNKKYLGKIFELNKEAIGFDTVDECVDLCRYYLDHDKERRLIAANGWRRAIKDYNVISIFQRRLDIIEKYRNKANLESKIPKIDLREQGNPRNSVLSSLGYPFMWILYFMRLTRRFLRIGIRIILLNMKD